MKAVVWRGDEDARLETVDDPNREAGRGAGLYGHMHLYCGVLGGQAEYLLAKQARADQGSRGAGRTVPSRRLPSDDASRGYELFQKKEDGAIKIVLAP